MSLREPVLYFLILFLMTGVVLVAFGGGLFGQAEPWMMQWQHQAFSNLCHQAAERSFWINGQPMAVCSRCLGIYAGFLAGWGMLPLMGFFEMKKTFPFKKVLLVFVIINVIDVFGNLLGFWQNTLISRMALGLPAGLGATALFTGSFFITNQNKKNKGYYGRVTTSGTAK